MRAGAFLTVVFFTGRCESLSTRSGAEQSDPCQLPRYLRWFTCCIIEQIGQQHAIGSAEPSMIWYFWVSSLRDCKAQKPNPRPPHNAVSKLDAKHAQQSHWPVFMEPLTLPRKQHGMSVASMSAGISSEQSPQPRCQVCIFFFFFFVIEKHFSKYFFWKFLS